MPSKNNIITQIANLGYDELLQPEEKQKVRLTNILATIPMLVYVYFIIWGLLNDYYFPVFMGSLTIISGIFGLYFNYKKKYGIAKLILFSSCSLVIFITYNSLNIDYSVTAFAFPLFIAYQILFNIRLEKKYFLLSFFLTVLCVVACFVLPKYILYKYEMEYNLMVESITINYVASFLLSALFILLNVNTFAKIETKLISAIKESERANKAKSDFLSNISHELRTPLNGIIGTTNLLLFENATQSQKKYHDILKHTSDHMLHLINHILDFSKINEGKINLDRNVFNLKHTIAKLCNVYTAQDTQEGIAFTFEIDDELNKPVISDDLRIKQILFNLLSNSFKFTKKGNISLQVKLLETVGEKMRVKFIVADTGVGIKPEQMQKIFESFEQADNSTTRNFGGTGLGLSISKELVKLFGSTLKVASEYKKGSTFSFEIEVEEHIEIMEKSIPVTQKKLTGLHILVAEDNKVNMMILVTFLKKWDVQYTAANNGLEALEQFKKTDFDIILMDLEMPEMDGYTAIKEIRKIDTTIPVIAFTAAIYDNMSADLKQKGFNNHLHKPFNPDDLYRKLSSYNLKVEEIVV